MFDLFYVESPLQLLSAIAAKKVFKNKSILIVNVSYGNLVNNDKQIKALINKNEWFKVHIQKRAKNKYWGLLTTLTRTFFMYFRYKDRIERYCYGEFRNIDMSALGLALKPKQLILLDDGTFTITVQNYYIKNNKIPYGTQHFTGTIYKKCLKVNLDKAFIPNLYSFFDFTQSSPVGQINYFDFKPKYEIETNNDEVYFFGSKFSESGFLTQEFELGILRYVRDTYKDYLLYYIPHREESSDKLNKIIGLGFIQKSLGRPAELFFDDTEVMPHKVISCYSTTLYSCFSRFSNVGIVSIDIRAHIIDEGALLNAENIYEYYKSIGMNIEYLDSQI